MTQTYYALLLVPNPGPNEFLLGIQAFSTSRDRRIALNQEGTIEFFYPKPDLLRPFRLLWNKNGKMIPEASNNIRPLFEKAKYVLIDDTLPESTRQSIQGFLKDFQLEKKAREIKRCPFCAISGRTTFMTAKRPRYRAYDQEVCFDCAISEIERDLKAEDIHLDDATRDYAKTLLRRTRNISSVLALFRRGPAKLGEHTLVGTFEAVSAEKPVDVKDLGIDERLKDAILARGIELLLPIQRAAIRAGLLEGADLLIIADTSAGKTLIGEIAGINMFLREGKRTMFCFPLVALANTKYEAFRQSYGKKLGLKIGIRVGRTRIVMDQHELLLRDTAIRQADVVVGTYEGLDQVIRSRPDNLRGFGCIIIDEIQSIEDSERGATLDGLISRLRVLYPETQILALSATVGNPKELAELLKLRLVAVKGRPVELEQHILFCRNEEEKYRAMHKLVREEWKMKSSKGYRGQTIIFTHSRRKTHIIARRISGPGLDAAAYHSGLPYSRRKRVETAFDEGRIPVVAATYALGAGVDFPASQVIFESLLMGKDVLDRNTFQQMLGRAGRLGKHDRGRAVIPVLPQALLSSIGRSEMEVALALLREGPREVRAEHTEEDSAEQILATVTALEPISSKKLGETFDSMAGTQSDFKSLLQKLEDDRLVSIDSTSDHLVTPTLLGRAGSVSFFKPHEIVQVRKRLQGHVPPIEIALELEPLENVFISAKLQTYLERTFRTRFGSRLFSGAALDVMDASRSDNAEIALDRWILALFAKWSTDLFVCNCEDKPYCECGRNRINKMIVDLRRGGEFSAPRDISGYFKDRYELYLFPGDIYKWLEVVLHRLEGIGRISVAFSGKRPPDLQSLIREIEFGGPVDKPSEKKTKSP